MKSRISKFFILMMFLPALVSGCASGRGSQQSSTPTVSGSISTAAEKHF
jgi:hypothetical protein